MLAKKLFASIFILSTLLVSLSRTTVAQAALVSECGNTVTVARGDTLSKIAARCGVTVNGILRANPQITDPNLISVGQVLVLPGATLPGDNGTFIYYIERGDTLKELAIRFRTSVDELLALNPQITNPDRIYAGQRLVVPNRDTGTGIGGGGDINLPGGTQIYTVQEGDTLKGIARLFGTTSTELRALNPQIKNPDMIFVGQQIIVPNPVNSYVVRKGDTLGEIALRFNTTVSNLLKLNPQITDPNLIVPGQVLRIR